MKVDETAGALSRLAAEIERLRSEIVSHQPDVLLSFRKAAKLLGIDRGATLNALVRSGQLRTVSAGKRQRIPMSEINRLAAVGFDSMATKPRAKRAKAVDVYEHPTTWKLVV